MIMYKKNFYYTQKFQERVHNQAVKPRSYALGIKIWLNNKYIRLNKTASLRPSSLALFKNYT